MKLVQFSLSCLIIAQCVACSNGESDCGGRLNTLYMLKTDSVIYGYRGDTFIWKTTSTKHIVPLQNRWKSSHFIPYEGPYCDGLAEVLNTTFANNDSSYIIQYQFHAVWGTPLEEEPHLTCHIKSPQLNNILVFAIKLDSINGFNKGQTMKTNFLGEAVDSVYYNPGMGIHYLRFKNGYEVVRSY